MAQSNFGVGWLTALSGAVPVATRFGRLQDVSVDFSFDLKMLYGQNQFAVEQARGKGKIDIKATSGVIDPVLFNNVYFGDTLSTGEELSSIDEVGAVPGTSTYTITVSNAATFNADLGVYNVTSKLWLVRVASGPSAGQYSVNNTTGVYTFNSAQAAASVRITYTYASSATGSTITGTNPIMGANVIFGLTLVDSFTGTAGKKSLYLTFPAVQASKLNMPLKLDDWTLPTFDMSAQDDGGGNVFTWSMTG